MERFMRIGLTTQETSRRRLVSIVSFGIWAVALLFVAPRVLSGFDLNLLGKFLAFAIVALGLDLLWGYTGMLSLGQGLFFGLGAYCIALYTQLEQAGGKLPEFMGLYGVTELPWFCQPFHSPAFAVIMAVLPPFGLPAVFRFLVLFRPRSGAGSLITSQVVTTHVI